MEEQRVAQRVAPVLSPGGSGSGKDDYAARMTLNGREVDAAEIAYDQAEQLYLAAVRRKETHVVLAHAAEEAERRARVWVDQLREYVRRARAEGIEASEREQEAEALEGFLRNFWEELAEAHRMPPKSG